eukprot:8677517-Karenia_brevis.AAC.1
MARTTLPRARALERAREAEKRKTSQRAKAKARVKGGNSTDSEVEIGNHPRDMRRKRRVKKSNGERIHEHC